MGEDGFKLSTSRVAIVGLGLMGASLAMDLRGYCAEIIGASRSPVTLKYALDHQIVDRVTEFSPDLECDLIILAAPVRTIIQQLQMMSVYNFTDHSPKKTVVLDLGSTKTEIVHAMQTLPARFDPIGGHPMCGKEMSGIQQAEANLYRNKTFILTPLECTSDGGVILVKEMVRTIGGLPLILTPERQDDLVAMTSHLPYLLASALMMTTLGKDDEQLWNVAAAGFRDTSRLAASDLTMMMDILLTNRDAILDALSHYRNCLETLTSFLRSADESALRQVLSRTQNKRSNLFRQEN